MVKNYQIIVANLEAFAQAHMQIQRFKSSYLSKIEGFAKEDRTFPILYAVPAQIQASRYINTYSFKVYILDKTNNAQDNEIAVLNTAESILRDLTIWIKESENGLELSNEPVFEPIEDYLMDWGFIGWSATFDVVGPAFSSDCSIPFVDNFLTTYPSGVNCDINYPPALTCDSLTGCTTIQTIQSDIEDLKNSTFTGGTVSGFTSFINGISATTLQGDGSSLILSKSQLTNTIGEGTYIPYSGANGNVDLGVNEITTGKLWLYDEVGGPDEKGSLHYADEALHFENSDGETLLYVEPGFMQIHKTGAIQSNLFVTNLTQNQDHYLPNKSGTILVDSDLSTYQAKSEKNQVSGYAGLDINGLLTTNLFPDSILGNVKFKGTYNGSLIVSADATINGHTLPTASSGNTGWYFISTSAYTASTIAYEVGDWILSIGTSWSKVDNTDAVMSFNGRLGNITLLSSDVTTALGYTPYNTSNPNGYISGITSSNVTTALGYTPYNSTNPNNYISGITNVITGTGVSNAVAFYNNTNSITGTTGFTYNGNLGIGTASPTHSLTLNNTSTGIAHYNTADQTTNYQRFRKYWSGNYYYSTGESAGTGFTVGTIFGTRNGLNNIMFNQTVTGGITTSYNSLISLNAGGATWQPALYSGTTYKPIFNVGGTLTGTTAGTHNFFQIAPSILGASAYTAPISVLKVTPNIQNIGTGTTYLIDAGVNTLGDGLGTHTSVFSVNTLGNTLIGTTTDTGQKLQVSGNTLISGGLTINGRVTSNVQTLIVTSNTTTIDCSLGNYYKVTLGSSVTTTFNITNIPSTNVSQTIILQVTTGTSSAVSFPSTIKQPSGATYFPTQTVAIDILTFVTLGDGNLFMVSTKNLS